jgi:hypothetical protein
MIGCLESGIYCQIRNAVIVLTKVGNLYYKLELIPGMIIFIHPLTKLGAILFYTRPCVCACIRSTTERTAGAISLKFVVRIPMGNTIGGVFHFCNLTYFLASRRPS